MATSHDNVGKTVVIPQTHFKEAANPKKGRSIAPAASPSAGLAFAIARPLASEVTPNASLRIDFCHNKPNIFLPDVVRVWPVQQRMTFMASDLIKHITDASFEADVLQPGSTVLVDFWAEWCGPCKMIAPILDEVATAYQGKLSIAKMNVDENRAMPAKFGIRGIPTLMLFKNGELAATKVGALSKAQLTAFIDQQLA
jgi:thioredoxin 1